MRKLKCAICGEVFYNSQPWAKACGEDCREELVSDRAKGYRDKKRVTEEPGDEMFKGDKITFLNPLDNHLQLEASWDRVRSLTEGDRQALANRINKLV